MIRYTITAGRFSDSDFFDDNNYSHDPRTQFMAWGMMYNGAWDYPADTRGYTWGIVNEFHTRNWSFKYGVAAEPRVANGGRSIAGFLPIKARPSRKSAAIRS